VGTKSTARRKERQRKALARREQELAALARRQHGVISRRQLIAGGLSLRTIARWVDSGRLGSLYRSVYVFGHSQMNLRGEWMAAVLACGDRALLSHRSAAALWALTKRSRRHLAEVTATAGRGRPGIIVHEGGIHKDERAVLAHIPVTSVARTLFDLAEVVDERGLGRAFEEADRLNLLQMKALEDVCARGYGRRALRPIRRLIEEAHAPVITRTDLEERFALFCREYDIVPTATNVEVLGDEVDSFWPRERVIVELDGYAFHRHRAAFETDRRKDVARQVAGYRAIRITDRRLEREPAAVASEIRALLNLAPGERRAGT
jgi:predicted transcriptional regulator of viral defense system